MGSGVEDHDRRQWWWWKRGRWSCMRLPFGNAVIRLRGGAGGAERGMGEVVGSAGGTRGNQSKSEA